MAETDTAPRPRRLRRALIAAGAMAALSVAGLGVASAQTDPSTTTAPEKSGTAQSDPAPPPGPGPREFRGHPGGPGGPGGPGFFFKGFGGPGIHSESTFKNPEGEGYKTVASQMGEVVDVSQGSLEVKSEDGFTRTYKLTEDTMVMAGRDGIGNVKKGDQVHVMADVADGTATARHVADVTNLERLRPQRAEKKPR